MELITQLLKLKEIFPAKAVGELADADFVRKGYIPAKTDFQDGERAVVNYITTGALDRDNEVLRPDGADLTDYLKHPVVLGMHNYSALPVGKCAWVKRDEKGLIGKTIYATHQEANDYYEYQKAGFPMAFSVGFVSVESVWRGQTGFEKELASVVQKGWVDKADAGRVERIFTKWLMLEYSAVAVPSNPEALTIAVAKKLVPAGSGQPSAVGGRQGKQGRVLSTANRELLTNAITEIESALKDIKELLESTGADNDGDAGADNTDTSGPDDKSGKTVIRIPQPKTAPLGALGGLAVKPSEIKELLQNTLKAAVKLYGESMKKEMKTLISEELARVTGRITSGD